MLDRGSTGQEMVMHLSMLSLRGVGPQAHMGQLISIAFPTLGNLTKNLGSRMLVFALFTRGNRTKAHHPMCSSVCSVAIKALKNRCFQWRYMHFLFLYLYKNTTSHYSFSKLIDGTPYFVELCALLMIWTLLSSGNQALEVY